MGGGQDPGSSELGGGRMGRHGMEMVVEPKRRVGKAGGSTVRRMHASVSWPPLGPREGVEARAEEER